MTKPGRIALFPAAMLPFALMLPLALGGCGSLLAEGTSDAAGIGGAGIAGAISKNATVGAAIGVGVKSLADFGLQYAERRAHGTEQDEIAAVAGALPEGGVGNWNISHSIPIEPDEHGEIVVARDLGGPDIACKEIVFSIDSRLAEKPARAFYTATVCKDGPAWKWATAEPATSRWGGLQ